METVVLVVYFQVRTTASAILGIKVHTLLLLCRVHTS